MTANLLIETPESKAPTPKSDEIYQSIKSGRVLYSCDGLLLKYLSLVLQSGFLRNEPLPLSTVFISRAGIGKSRLMKILKKEKYVYYVTDVTPKFLVTEFLEEMKRGRYRFICIPDFTNVTDSHSFRTGSTVVSLLRNITAEGAGKIRDFGMEFETDRDIYAGLITGTTISSYGVFAEAWKSTGFLSRLLPFSFTHSPTTQASIIDDINSGKPEPIANLPRRIIKKPVRVDDDPDLLRQLTGFAEVLALKSNSMPYRAQTQLNRLAKSNAVLRGDTKLTQGDIDEVGRLSRWLNYSFEAI